MDDGAITEALAMFRRFMVPYLVAMAVTLMATPILRLVAVRCDLYDRPDSGLKPHERPIPYLGGAGIWLGWLAVLLLAMRTDGPNRWLLTWIALGGGVVMLIGLVDDIRQLPPVLRLLIQAAVGGLLLYVGFGRGVWAALWPSVQAYLPAWFSTDTAGLIINAAFFIFLLLGATNSTNLIDGLDGLCGGIITIAFLGFWIVALLLSHTAEAPAADATVALRITLCAGVVGACAAFLCYNFHPASVFMGDSGSLLLGYNVAVMIALCVEQGAWRGLAAALLVFGFPILDTSLAIARRWLNGRPLFVGDRSHLYDQLRDRGLSVRGAVYACYVLGVLFAGLGMACVLLQTRWVVGTVVGVPLLAALIGWRCGLLRVDNAGQRSQDPGQG
jgi:UDP-GlcNAc:undecaprenyl-phosphate/decaprenyl-phosphate GlcNAc-1-phosphate transferase